MQMKTVDIKKTSRNILSKCAEKGYTVKMIQEELRLDSTQAIYRWFSTESKSLPTLNHLVMLSVLLDCKIDDLIITMDIPDI